MLVTAWRSRRNGNEDGLKGRLDSPLEIDDSGNANIKKWAADNGINPRQVIETLSIANQTMPRVLREMDVAL